MVEFIMTLSVNVQHWVTEHHHCIQQAEACVGCGVKLSLRSNGVTRWGGDAATHQLLLLGAGRQGLALLGGELGQLLLLQGVKDQRTRRNLETHTDIRTHTHRHKDTHTQKHMHTHRHKDTHHKHMHTHRHKDTQTYAYAHRHKDTHKDTRKRIHTHSHKDTHTHRNICTHTDTKTHTHKQTYPHTQTQRHKHIHTQTQRHTHTHANISTHTDTKTQRHTHTNISTHTDTKTHTHANISTHTDTKTHTKTHTSTSDPGFSGVEEQRGDPRVTKLFRRSLRASPGTSVWELEQTQGHVLLEGAAWARGWARLIQYQPFIQFLSVIISW